MFRRTDTSKVLLYACLACFHNFVTQGSRISQKNDPVSDLARVQEILTASDGVGLPLAAG